MSHLCCNFLSFSYGLVMHVQITLNKWHNHIIMSTLQFAFIVHYTVFKRSNLNYKRFHLCFHIKWFNTSLLHIKGSSIEFYNQSYKKKGNQITAAASITIILSSSSTQHFYVHGTVYHLIITACLYIM